MECPECNMAYAEYLPEDRKQHRIYHDQIVNGVPAPHLKSDVIIWRINEDRIIAVNSYSPMPQRVRASKVGSAANQEMHYDGGIYSRNERPDERNIHLFLYCSKKRAIGLAKLEKRSFIVKYTWEEYDKNIQKEMIESDSIWSLGFIWVHKKHRKNGIAKTILTEAISYLGVSISGIGLYTPLSEEGEHFAKSIFPVSFLIAK